MVDGSGLKAILAKALRSRLLSHWLMFTGARHRPLPELLPNGSRMRLPSSKEGLGGEFVHSPGKTQKTTHTETIFRSLSSDLSYQWLRLRDCSVMASPSQV